MIGFNSGEVITICGNVVRDAHHIKDTEGVKIDVAVNRKEKKDGSYVDVPVYYSIAVFGKDAEFAHKHFKKGDKIMATGQPATRTWIKDGAVGISHEIKFANLTNLHKAPRDQEGPAYDPSVSGTEAPF